MKYLLIAFTLIGSASACSLDSECGGGSYCWKTKGNIYGLCRSPYDNEDPDDQRSVNTRPQAHGVYDGVMDAFMRGRELRKQYENKK